jgi:hypothetical protein
MIETLTTARMIPSGTNSPGLFVPEGIIRPVVSVSIIGSIPLLVDY